MNQAQLTGAASVSPELKAVLIRTPHFWFTLIAVTISAALGVGLIPPGPPMQWALLIQAVLTWYGYQAGVQFRPPQQQWPMAQRVAMGLAPLPPLPADVPRAVTEAMYVALHQALGTLPGVPTSLAPPLQHGSGGVLFQDEAARQAGIKPPDRGAP